MITFEKFIMDDSGPIYAQIIRYVKRGIVAGNIVDGDEMPSRRVLSSLLGVNPNTIQKSYRILEEEGIIQSHAGAKSYVVLDPEKVTTIRTELIESDVGAIIGAMKQSGVSKEEALKLIDRLWEIDPAKKPQE
ncbi:MAG: GntR family transcriptional regulator [Firmicutes bacterium]|nr:GntR family transcriptional regulator [Bacillota bacterium]